MSDSLTGYFYQHRILLTPLQVIMDWPKRCSENSASQTILLHMGRTISATGKTKVGGKLPLCSFAKFGLPVEFEKHMSRPAKVYP